MKKRYQVILIFIFIIILALLVFSLINSVLSTNVDEIIVLDEIEGYNYKLEDRDTSLYENHFYILEDILLSEEINYELYAKEIAMLYIIDLYTIDNKNSKYDIGGTEFVLPEYTNDYNNKVSDTLYKYVNHVDFNEIPIVSSVSVDKVEESTYLLNEEEYSSYVLDVSWEYEKDYGYEKQNEIVIINMDNKLYIVETGQEE